MSTLSDLLAGMSDFFTRILNLLPTWVKKVMPGILAITTAILTAAQKGEAWLESQTAQTIVQIIPGTEDDAIRNGLMVILKKAIPCLVKLEDFEKQDLGAMLLAFLKSLSQAPTAKALNSNVQALSSLMLAAHDGDKLPENRYDTLSQMAYSHLQGADKK